ncbi:MAG: DUF6660 family protein [Bacteroidota bacterium]|nr:MAG: hypothetical protein F9K23_18215 [Bacteroidota bacterium]
MKYVLIILSIYLFSLSCIPCSDNKECDIIVSSLQNIGGMEHDEHNHTSESCTPFCTCSCCSTVAPCNTIARFQFVQNTTPDIVYPVLGDNFYSQYFNTIWQPPKIG